MYDLAGKTEKLYSNYQKNFLLYLLLNTKELSCQRQLIMRIDLKRER
jgi:hypothetical protein